MVSAVKNKKMQILPIIFLIPRILHYRVYIDEKVAVRSDEKDSESLSFYQICRFSPSIVGILKSSNVGYVYCQVLIGKDGLMSKKHNDLRKEEIDRLAWEDGR